MVAWRSSVDGSPVFGARNRSSRKRACAAWNGADDTLRVAVCRCGGLHGAIVYFARFFQMRFDSSIQNYRPDQDFEEALIAGTCLASAYGFRALGSVNSSSARKRSHGNSCWG